MPNAIRLDNKLGKDLMPLNILSKFGDDLMKYVQVREQTTVKYLAYSRANSKMANVIRLDIELDQYFMLINILSKFGDDPMKFFQVKRADQKCLTY